MPQTDSLPFAKGATFGPIPVLHELGYTLKMTEGTQRRLAAIVSADVVGYRSHSIRQTRFAQPFDEAIEITWILVGQDLSAMFQRVIWIYP